MKRSLSGKRILVTAGPTREFLDPVRFLSNPSSGEMGIRVAEALRARGADVTLVLGPTWLSPPARVTTVTVVTAEQMQAAIRKRLRTADALVATAAVSDWRFERPRRTKTKKGSSRRERVTLVRTPDILAEAGRFKSRQRPALRLIGFALETGRLEAHARRKLREKNLDLIVGNAPSSFSSSRIRPLWIERQGTPRRLGSLTKAVLATRIAGWLAASFHAKRNKVESHRVR